MSLQLSETQIDLLREIANIGSGNAMTALCQLLGRKVSLYVPQVRLLSISEMEDLIGEPDSITVCIFFRIYGEAKGSILILLPEDSAKVMIRSLSKAPAGDFFEEADASTLKEVGNILTGAYLNAVSQVLNLTLLHSLPGLAVDSVRALLDSILIDLSQKIEKAVLIETEFVTETSITGHFFLLPDPESLEYFFKVLG